jgi:hypothetical protein
VRVAVRAIYSGLPTAQLLVQFPASDGAPAHALRVAFADSENARANITYCSLLNDVLPRTHPAAFAALLSEAYKAGVTEVHVTSCWRPMLGSIAHRAGLGLDIVYVANASQTVRINRVGLTGAGGRNPNIRAREKQLYDEYMEAKRLAGNNKQTDDQRGDAKRIENQAKKDWLSELQKNDPALINDLRARLKKNPSIEQIFDPWYMQIDTGSEVSSANEQRSPNETLHANHLHLTINEPEIL